MKKEIKEKIEKILENLNHESFECGGTLIKPFTNQILELLKIERIRKSERLKLLERIKLWERIYGKTISTRIAEGENGKEAIIKVELDKFYCDGYNQAIADLEKLKEEIKDEK